MAKSKKKHKKNKRAKLTAKTADKHDLYQRSVQDAETEMRWVSKTFKQIRKRKALTFREDFCGTALLSKAWVESGKQRSAVGVDIDRDVLAWGIDHNLSPIGEPGEQITLLEQDVRDPVPGKFDVVGAFNFSYWIFKTRDSMRDYFERVRKSLQSDGVFMLDAYGGWESMEPMYEHRPVKGGFTYVWDQDLFDPVTHHIRNYIHFRFKDGSKLKKAFTYDWRYWSLPELTELLTEAGFSEVRVYWDVADDDEDPRYRVVKSTENQPGWLAYLVALR